jgi:prolipoprotein diacylglyceryl transferase
MIFASIVWDVDPVLLHLGSWEIRWYGLMWGLGFIFAYEIMARLFRKEQYPENWVDKLFIYCIVSSVIGARLGHCLFYEWDFYTAHPVEILKIWKGGLASHGGVFALILALIIYSKKVTKKNVWWLFDRMIPAVAIVCLCIRFGNLMKFLVSLPHCHGDLNSFVLVNGKNYTIRMEKHRHVILLKYTKCFIV